MGRKLFTPTKEHLSLAEKLSGLGVPQTDIALIIGISKPTLHRHFKSQLDIGQAKANANIASTLYKIAIAGNITALIFWAKTRMGWKDKERELNDDDDQSIRFELSKQ